MSPCQTAAVPVGFWLRLVAGLKCFVSDFYFFFHKNQPEETEAVTLKQ